MTPRVAILISLVSGMLGGTALAKAPSHSPLPNVRPSAARDAAVALVAVTPVSAAFRPVPRPSPGAVPRPSPHPVVARFPAAPLLLPGALPRPVPRPAAARVPAGPLPSPIALPRPVPRPAALSVSVAPRAPAVPVKPVKVVLASAGTAVFASPRPGLRPENLKRRFIVRAAGVRAQPAAPVVTGSHGAVCGDRAIRGQTLSSIPGRLKGCGVANPVRITSVDGVALSQPATLNCTAAKALKTWVSGTVKPTVGRLGGGVESLRVAAHYSCRTRNNVRGARVSEHGRGNAIDISAIVLKNGVALTVLKGWRDQVQSRLLQTMHRNACGTFGTVLGPNADRFHQDHFHLDVARQRGKSYCR